MRVARKVIGGGQEGDWVKIENNEQNKGDRAGLIEMCEKSLGVASPESQEVGGGKGHFVGRPAICNSSMVEDGSFGCLTWRKKNLGVRGGGSQGGRKGLVVAQRGGGKKRATKRKNSLGKAPGKISASQSWSFSRVMETESKGRSRRLGDWDLLEGKLGKWKRHPFDNLRGGWDEGRPPQREPGDTKGGVK